ncbi:hypothetical protein [Aquibacillus rhizosphaerae]|uniref:Uncharacterized protein n=1 Tax=Aquibacillus rhizosphaerae TaxID=3051431 RepID=A0ABT7L5N3_9BACI|nr:hypothetical protein [Aquibacillus sp. LR5S19]MDL4839871.1 hypothetical protein [Aquibacillus sp. LR5S19]
MKETATGIISIILTILIHEWVTALLNLEYNLFSDEFNLVSACLDLGIWLAIFTPIYFVIKKLFGVKKQKG